MQPLNDHASNTEHLCSYPNSKWDNIRNNMGQGGSTAPTTTVPGTTTGSTGPTNSPGSCGGVAAWSASVNIFSPSSKVLNTDFFD